MKHEAENLKGEIVDIDPVMIVSLPNRPSWQENESDYKDYFYSLGRDIIDTNIIELREQNLKIDPAKAPDLTQEILGLSDEEKAQMFNEELAENEIKERFLVAKFINEFLNLHLKEGKFKELIRRNAPAYNERNMIEMIGDGEGIKLVGLTWDAFELYNGS